MSPYWSLEEYFLIDYRPKNWRKKTSINSKVFYNIDKKKVINYSKNKEFIIAQNFNWHSDVISSNFSLECLKRKEDTDQFTHPAWQLNDKLCKTDL